MNKRANRSKRNALALLLIASLFPIFQLPALAQAPCVAGPFNTNPNVTNPPAIPSGVTHFVLKNNYQSNTYAVVNTQLPGGIVQDGCTTDVTQLMVTDVTNPSSPGAPVQVIPLAGTSSHAGYFLMLSNHTYEMQSILANPTPLPAGSPPQVQNCLQGLIVSFDQQSQCPGCCNSGGTSYTAPFPTQFVPGPSIPNGVNGAEVSLNLPGTIGGNATNGLNESCDITCVNGANTKLRLTVAPSTSAKPWTYDQSTPVTAAINTENSWVNIAGQCDDNCKQSSVTNGGTPVTMNRIGVFPYGCSVCNQFPDPEPPCKGWFANNNGAFGAPGCTPNGTSSSNFYQFCAQGSTASCLFQRTPDQTKLQTQQFGGTIAFVYRGPITPPLACPTGTSNLLSSPGLPPATSDPVFSLPGSGTGRRRTIHGPEKGVHEM